MKKFFYARISTKEQNEQRQLISAAALGLFKIDEEIYLDKLTGSNFDRRKYKEVVKQLREGDVLYVHELDRFGRDYTEIKDQIQEIEKKGVIIEFLDLPTIKTGDPLTDKLIRDQMINTLAYVAEKETEKRKKRQVEGIQAMPINADGKKYSLKTGRPTGRPPVVLPSNFESVYNRVKNKQLEFSEALKILEIKKTSYYKYAKILKESKMKDQMPGQTYLLVD